MAPSRLAACLVVWLAPSVACAQDTAPPDREQSAETGLWTRDTLLGDAGGLRSLFAKYGISFGIEDTNEVFGNVTGGIRRGADDDGATLFSIGLDTEHAFGRAGGTFNVSAWNIRGRNIVSDNLLNLQAPSDIAAADTTRLWEAWFQQSFLDGKLDVKLGMQSIDLEFMTSDSAGLFLNSAMGWSELPAADLYAGGPTYPLSSLGVRLRAQTGGPISALVGVFDDNPPGGSFDDDSPLHGSTRWGGNFSLRTGALVIGEVQYALNQPEAGDKHHADALGALPGTYKLGFWYDSAPFPDQRFDNTGLSLANPASNGTPLMLRNNFSIYAVADQMVWRPDAKSPRSANMFLRLTGAPGDRNLISFTANGGVTLKAPLPGRDDDTVGIGFGAARLSSGARGLDSDTAFFTASPFPVRTAETFIEVTYQYQLAPWWQLQPDFQYVFNPGGGILNPNNPAQRIGNEASLGLHTVVTF